MHGPAVLIVLLGFAIAAPETPGAGQDRGEPGPSDLSVCRREISIPPGGEISVTDFAAKLHGTWLLNTRTIQGLTIDTDSRFYFDMASSDESEARGTALMLDRGNLGVLDPLEACKACKADASLGALWTVSVTRSPDRQMVTLTMAGDYLGSYGDFVKGVHATETAVFVRNGDRYVAGRLVSPAGGQGMPDDVWDRIGLEDGRLTYVSCRGGFIDRFEKLSGGTPDVEGLALGPAWDKAKRDGWLVNPLPVKRGR